MDMFIHLNLRVQIEWNKIENTVLAGLSVQITGMDRIFNEYRRSGRKWKYSFCSISFLFSKIWTKLMNTPIDQHV